MDERAASTIHGDQSGQSSVERANESDNTLQASDSDSHSNEQHSDGLVVDQAGASTSLNTGEHHVVEAQTQTHSQDTQSDINGLEPGETIEHVVEMRKEEEALLLINHNEKHDDSQTNFETTEEGALSNHENIHSNGTTSTGSTPVLETNTNEPNGTTTINNKQQQQQQQQEEEQDKMEDGEEVETEKEEGEHSSSSALRDKYSQHHQHHDVDSKSELSSRNDREKNFDIGARKDELGCFICKESGHVAKNCPARREASSTTECFYCHRTGHRKYECPKRYPYNERARLYQRRENTSYRPSGGSGGTPPGPPGYSRRDYPPPPPLPSARDSYRERMLHDEERERERERYDRRAPHSHHYSAHPADYPFPPPPSSREREFYGAPYHSSLARSHPSSSPVSHYPPSRSYSHYYDHPYPPPRSSSRSHYAPYPYPPPGRSYEDNPRYEREERYIRQEGYPVGVADGYPMAPEQSEFYESTMREHSTEEPYPPSRSF